MKSNLLTKVKNLLLDVTEVVLILLASLSIAALVIATIANSKAFGQKAEIGIVAGASNYLGEIGGDANPARPFIHDLQYNMTQIASGAFYRYELSRTLSYRINLIYGRIAGDDRYSSNYGRHLRNLHFRSDIFEVSAQAEVMIIKKTFSLQANPFKGSKKSANFSIKGEIGLYALGGIGLFHFNPQAQYEGKWVDLQPLGTEGQGILNNEIDKADKKYDLTQTSLPLGAGLYYRFGQYKIGFEIGWRMTFTDYLDDVSKNYVDPAIVERYNGKVAAAISNRADEITDNKNELVYAQAGQKRGDPSNNDSYIFSLVSFSYFLNADKPLKK